MPKFIVLSTQRTGSTYFRMWLNQHPQVRCHGEVFFHNYNAPDGFHEFIKKKSNLLLKVYSNNTWQKINRVVLSGRGNSFLLKNHTKLFLSSLYTNPEHPMPFMDFESSQVNEPVSENPNKNIAGFKLMCGQLEQNKQLRNWITNERPLIIHFVRDNKIDIAISRMQAWSSGLYHSDKHKQRKIIVNPEQLLKVLHKIKQQEQVISKFLSAFKVFTLSYESFFEESGYNSSELLNFLGAPNASMNKMVKLSKVGENSLKNRIENYDLVYDALKQSDFQHYL